MAAAAKPDMLERIEADARKVPPLTQVLLLFAIATCPVWVSAAIAAFAAFSSPPPPEEFYVTLSWFNAGGLAVSFIIALVAGRTAVRRKTELAKQSADLSSFCLGWGVVRVAWKDWWSWAWWITFIVYFVAGREIDKYVMGIDSAVLSQAESFWYMVARATLFTGLFFCFLGLCIWLGRREQNLRAAQ